MSSKNKNHKTHKSVFFEDYSISEISYNKNKNLEVIIADDGSHYSKSIVNNYSQKIDIPNDIRDI